ncbi:hypothetical protein [Agromyces cerinus]|uniref:Uncharacterized protein n=1 Tax=Agromyces cerinus subsp. cerinus TaxID=232089 RepID=A0A1N6HA23_9MICO|nr:hypothetical protein [Agromyces cerinus]SIO16600.1 hypothetical protein SAMN05443544_3015 [Agromyces cerinus subsp. cerinus]
MPAPRSKPLLAWEPFPYLVVFVLLLLTGIVRPEGPPWLLWPFLAILAAAVAWLIVGLVRGSRRSNPDQWGDLTSLDGLELVDAERVERGVRAVAPVVDEHRHQPAIELARLYGGPEQHAVLVPRASRWLSRRYRIGVQLVGGDRPRHAGFLSAAADDRWRDLLDGMREHGSYARVPALITGSSRPYGVELDLSGLERLGDATAE